MKPFYPFLFIAMAILSISANSPLETANDEYKTNVISFLRAIEITEEDSLILSDIPNTLSKNSICQVEDILDESFFSKEELKYLKKELKRSRIPKWSKEYFPKAKIVSGKEIENIFKKHSYGGWAEIQRTIGDGFHVCSSPIFLRNNTYCLFYRAVHCGLLCGGGGYTLYKREGNNWIKVKRYCGWMS